MKLADLAARHGLPAHHLSQILNEKLGLNFSDFVNGLCIKEVKMKLADPRLAHFSMEVIGWECGFANKAPFFRAFKKMTGRLPGRFGNCCKNSVRPVICVILMIVGGFP